MKKMLFAAVAALGLSAIPNTAEAQVIVYGNPGYSAFNYYNSPFYRSYNTVGYNWTPFGPSTYGFSAFSSPPIKAGPYFSFYQTPWGVQAGPGPYYTRGATPTFYQFYRFGP